MNFVDLAMLRSRVSHKARISERHVDELSLREVAAIDRSIRETLPVAPINDGLALYGLRLVSLRDTQPPPPSPPTDPPPPCPPTEPVLPEDEEDDEKFEPCSSCNGEGVVGCGGRDGNGEPIFIEVCLECGGTGR